MQAFSPSLSAGKLWLWQTKEEHHIQLCLRKNENKIRESFFGLR